MNETQEVSLSNAKVGKLLGIAALQVRASKDAQKQGRSTGGPSIHNLSREEFDALPTAPGCGVTEWRTFSLGGRHVYWSKDVALKLSPTTFSAFCKEAPVSTSEPVANVCDQVASDMARNAGVELAAALAELVKLRDSKEWDVVDEEVWARARAALKLAGRL